MWRSGKKLYTFEFSRPFVLNDMQVKKIENYSDFFQISLDRQIKMVWDSVLVRIVLKLTRI